MQKAILLRQCIFAREITGRDRRDRRNTDHVTAYVNPCSSRVPVHVPARLILVPVSVPVLVAARLIPVRGR